LILLDVDGFPFLCGVIIWFVAWSGRKGVKSVNPEKTIEEHENKTPANKKEENTNDFKLLYQNTSADELWENHEKESKLIENTLNSEKIESHEDQTPIMDREKKEVNSSDKKNDQLSGVKFVDLHKAKFSSSEFSAVYTQQIYEDKHGEDDDNFMSPKKKQTEVKKSLPTTEKDPETYAAIPFGFKTFAEFKEYAKNVFDTIPETHSSEISYADTNSKKDTKVMVLSGSGFNGVSAKKKVYDKKTMQLTERKFDVEKSDYDLAIVVSKEFYGELERMAQTMYNTWGIKTDINNYTSIKFYRKTKKNSTLENFQQLMENGLELWNRGVIDTLTVINDALIAAKSNPHQVDASFAIVSPKKLNKLVHYHNKLTNTDENTGMIKQRKSYAICYNEKQKPAEVFTRTIKAIEEKAIAKEIELFIKECCISANTSQCYDNQLEDEVKPVSSTKFISSKNLFKSSSNDK
jgi:hypothetical protein